MNIFKSLIPPKRPDINISELRKIALDAGVKTEKEFCIIGIRGFYNKGKNQRAIYDDAIFIVSPASIVSFNANTDPGAFKKGIANLRCGSWLYKLGIHGLSKPKFLQYQALVQSAPVIVDRDSYGEDRGWFGINIHKGGRWSVSSLGCQTIHPSQWDEFIDKVKKRMVIFRRQDVKYILKDA